MDALRVKIKSHPEDNGWWDAHQGERAQVLGQISTGIVVAVRDRVGVVPERCIQPLRFWCPLWVEKRRDFPIAGEWIVLRHDAMRCRTLIAPRAYKPLKAWFWIDHRIAWAYWRVKWKLIDGMMRKRWIKIPDGVQIRWIDLWKYRVK